MMIMKFGLDSAVADEPRRIVKVKERRKANFMVVWSL
jgi:hypothetical protein